MSSLGSWIDAADLAAVALDLCPEGAATVYTRYEGRPRDFLETPGPTAARGTSDGILGRSDRIRSRPVDVARPPAEDEIDRVRAKLERIKTLARESGLLKQGKGGVARDEAPALRHGDGEGEGEAAPGAASSDEALQPFEPPEAALGARLAAFAGWAAERTGGADVFVIDSQGYPLVERGGDPDLLAAALLLADASRRAFHRFDARGVPREPLLHMELGDGLVLSVLAHESRYGGVCLGVHGRGKVPPSTAEALSAALARTL